MEPRGQETDETVSLRRIVFLDEDCIVNWYDGTRPAVKVLNSILRLYSRLLSIRHAYTTSPAQIYDACSPLVPLPLELISSLISGISSVEDRAISLIL